MNRAVLLFVAAVLVTAGAASATSNGPAATKAVSITATGFSPQEIQIRPGDTVTWRNADTTNRQVVSDLGVFMSPVLKPGATWSYTFGIDSSYSYHGKFKPSQAGTVHVVSSRVSVGVTRIRLIYGNPVRIFGSIPSGATGETVTLHIAEYGGNEITRDVVTSEGTYELTWTPRIRTSVYATWDGTQSPRTRYIGVRPLVIFRPLNLERNRFIVRVKAQKSYAHKLVRINRQNHRGIWKTTRIVRLNKFGVKRFTARFPRGRTKAQAWVRMAPGYQAGFSVISFVSR